MCVIMTADWSIHSFGSFYSYLLGSVDKALLNVVNNLANSVNEIAFMLACFWQPSRKLRAKATRSWVVNYVSFCICITSRLNDVVLHRLYLAGHANQQEANWYGRFGRFTSDGNPGTIP